MAYQQDFLEEDDKAQDPGQGGQVLSSDAPTSSAPGSQSGSVAGSSSPKQGSGFTNLSQYVDANKDQAAGMAKGITGKINNDISSTQQQANAFVDNTKQTADQNTVKSNQSFQDALKLNPDARAEKQWAGMFDSQTAGYKGPNDVTGMQPYQDISKKFQGIDQQAKSLKDPMKVGQAIQETYKQPNQQYTRGQGTLDSFLTTSGAGADSLNDFQNKYSQMNLAKGWEDQTQAANKSLADAKTSSEATRKQTMDSLAEGVRAQDAFAKQLQASKAQAEQEAAAAAAAKSAAAQQPAPTVPNTKVFDDGQGINIVPLQPKQAPINIAGDVPTEYAPINIAGNVPTEETPEQRAYRLEKEAQDYRQYFGTGAGR